MFNAIQVNKDDAGYRAEFVQLNENDLPAGDVRVRVEYSTLNYKDAMALTGRVLPIVQKFPMVPGIDLAGVVEESSSDRFKQGDRVLLNGYGIGEAHWGGLSELAQVSSDWLVPVPAALSNRDTMIIGTAGYTAMLSVQALQDQGVTPEKGDILVTGANGGVGSFSISLLSKLGYRVVASTGRPQEAEYLKRLGAAEIIHRDELNQPGAPMQPERWAGAVDCVGSHTLMNVLASTRYGGAVTACGLAQGLDLPGNLMPFILRSVKLIGVDCVTRPYADRLQAWGRLAELVTADMLSEISREISLAEVVPTAHALLDGDVRGRVLVNLGL